MAITIQYGPIGQALGLAQTAGVGQGRAEQQSRQLQAQQIANQKQAEMDQANANQIQMAMAQQELQARVAQQQQQDQQNNIYNQANLQLRQQGQQTATQNAQAQQAAQDAANQTKAEVAQSLEDQRAQAAQEQKVKADALAALSPEERKLAQFPVLAQQELNANQQTRDQMARAQMVHDTLKQRAVETNAEYMRALGLKPISDPLNPENNISAEDISAKQKSAKKASDDALTVYEKHAQSVNLPDDETAAPAAGGAAAPVDVAQPDTSNTPVGPSPHGPGGRRQMNDGSLWTWNGLTWTKG